MNNKKRVMIISVIVAVVVVLCLLIGLLGGKKKETDSPQEKAESQMTITEQDETKNNNSEEIVDIDDTKKEFDNSTEKTEVVNNSKKETASVENTSENEETVNINNQSSSTGTAEKPSGTAGKPSKPEEKKIVFPHNIEGTSLYIQYIDEYDGVFMEDGSDKEVSDIGAMVVTNKGNSHVEYARLTVKTGSGDMKFEVSTLPAGASAVVQESNASKYTDKKIKDIVCEAAFLDKLEMSADQVSVVENEDGSLQVTNLTEDTIPCVRVFYKFYMEDEEIYVGGITYTSKIKNLGAGKSCTVNPTHYVAGSSEVVMVRTYETAE